MMIETNLSREWLVQAAEQLRTELDLYENGQMLIKKGLLFYQMGTVHNVKVVDGLATALVIEEKRYMPTLDLAIVPSSRCTCGADFVCPHLLALFFHLYSNIGQVGKLVEEWRIKRSGKVLPLKKASDLLNQSNTQQSVQSWMTHFEQKYEQFQQMKKREAFEYIHQLCYQFAPLLRRNAPANRELKLLYSLHAGLFTFRKLVEYGEQLPNLSRYHSFLQANASHLIETIEDDLQRSLNSDLAASPELFVEESIEHVRHVLLAGHLLQYERLNIYRSMWALLLNYEAWIEKERQTLLKQRQLALQSNDSENFLVEYQLALAHLSFLQLDDKEAISLLETIRPFPLSYALGWLEHLIYGKRWERFKQWIQAALPHLPSSIDTFTYYDSYHVSQRLARLVGIYAEEANEYTIYEAVLQALFPYSSGEYSHFLFEHAEYKKWVDLHLFLDIDAGDIHRSLLKTVEAYDRSLLLPLYHRSVIKMLQLKNRQSYKTAVKYLKKLRTYYRHLKREDEWHMYLTKLVDEYKRYRAFQEELKKGKLIHD
jgi:hypothetical protein